MKLHDLSKPFECELCKVRYDKESNLRKHLSLKHKLNQKINDKIVKHYCNAILL